MSGRGVAAKVVFPLIIVAVLVWLAASSLGTDSDEKTAKYMFSELLQQARTSPTSIRSVTFHPTTQEVEFRYADGTETRAAYPVDESAFELQQVLESKHVSFDAKRTGSEPWWSLLTSLLPFVLLFGFWLFLMRNVPRKTSTGSTSPENPFGR